MGASGVVDVDVCVEDIVLEMVVVKRKERKEG